MEVVKTLKLRVKDKHANTLLAMARDVNMVFNFCNETQYRSLRNYCTKPDRKKWFTGFDLQKLTAGFVKCEGVTIKSSTVDSVCEEYALRVRQFRKQKLRWRVSNRSSAKYSLGWIPFKARVIKYRDGQLWINDRSFGLWDSYGLSKYELRAGSFNEDSRGRWYVNISVRVQIEEKRVPDGATSIGIDLGLKTMAAYSDGTVFDMPRWYRISEQKLATAQRANKKRQARTIHAKIRNQRKDAIHKETSSLIKKHAAIFVGNVSASAIAKTSMGKSVNDAAWTMFRTSLKYKAIRHCVVFQEVNEAFSTVTCSACSSRSGPSGLKGLRIREWVCADCGSIHDRDTNGAKNILRTGRCALAVGIPVH